MKIKLFLQKLDICTNKHFMAKQNFCVPVPKLGASADITGFDGTYPATGDIKKLNHGPEPILGEDRNFFKHGMINLPIRVHSLHSQWLNLKFWIDSSVLKVVSHEN